MLSDMKLQNYRIIISDKFARIQEEVITAYLKLFF